MQESRKSILALLKAYSEKLKQSSHMLSKAELLEQEGLIEKFLLFINSSDKVFSRQNLVGHFCGSAWVVNKSLDKVVLTHHGKLKEWIQLGGHADDEFDLYKVALKEAYEESGLKQLKAFNKDHLPIELSIHKIPEYKNVPAHLHYDVIFVFVAEDDQLVRSDESIDLRWFTFDEAIAVCNPDMHAQLRKLQAFLKSHLDKSP